MQVIDSGFGRTGTMAMKIALEQLGLKPGHHMVDIDQPASSAATPMGEGSQGQSISSYVRRR